jgi:dinuclear metal center YbgI/SA1388 family protein
MAITVKQVNDYIEILFPVNTAENWDYPGFIVGTSSSPVDKVYLSCDITLEVVKDAIANNCNYIFTHHPLFFKGVHFISDNDFRGEIVNLLLKNDISLYCAHTNADIAEFGTADTLAKVLELQNIKPITESGLGRYGKLPAPTTTGELATKLKELLPTTVSPIKYTGASSKEISTVALLPGSGDSVFPEVRLTGANVYITSDLRHHPSQDFISESNFGTSKIELIDVPHFSIESLFLGNLSKKFEQELEVDTIVSNLITEVWSNIC